MVRRLEDLGGVSSIFLTHRDDVADAHKFARHFGALRVIHRDELSAQADAEIVLDGQARIELFPGMTAIPTPGHTKGHCCLLYGKFLFTGDHLAWDRDTQELTAFQDYCWFSWQQQTKSMEQLLDFSFEWILPGHGQRVHLPAAESHRQLLGLVKRMRESLT